MGPARRRRSQAARIGLAVALLGLVGGSAYFLVSGGAGLEKPAAARPVPGRRILSVKWLGVADKGLPIDVEPLQPKAELAVGAKGKVVYRFTNRSDKPVAFQAVHHVAPGPAQDHFQKYECFCFKQQTLAPREVKDMPVGYRFDDALPAGVRSITIAYTLFPLEAGPHASHGDPEGSDD